MIARLALVAAAACVLPAGCAENHAAPPRSPPSMTSTVISSYDAGLPPARAVLALVPQAATTLQLVDLSAVRRQVGLPELTGHSSPGERASYRMRTVADAPVLFPGLLRHVDGALRTRYGFGEDDVWWEARFSGGHRPGWVIALRPSVDLGRVRAAVRRGVGPFRDATLDAADRLVVNGAVTPGEPVWASDPTWATLLPAPGEAFVVRRGCLPPDSLPTPADRAASQISSLARLAGFTVTFGDHVATARVSADREDLFDRVRLARSWPALGGRPFGSVFRHGVGDPSGGRIGYDVPRPPRAVALVRAGLLPFGVCGGPD